MATKKSFVVGSKVFAKIKGYPAWPAKIEFIKGKRYSVLFYGTGETGTVKLEDLYSYVEHKQQFIKNLKRKDYNDAVNEIEKAIVNDERNEDEEDEEEPSESEESAQASNKRKRKLSEENTDSTTTKASKANVDAKRKSKSHEDNAEKATSEESSESMHVKKPNKNVVTTSRSGRKIKVKRFSDDEDNSEDEPLQNKTLRIVPHTQLEALIAYSNRIKPLLVDKAGKPIREPERITQEIVLAALPNGQTVGIKFNVNRRLSFRNDLDRWEYDECMCKDALNVKRQLESGEIAPDNEPHLYTMNPNVNDREMLAASEIETLERNKVKLKYIQEEAKLVELDRTIKCCLSLDNAEPERALESLKQMQKLNIDALMLKKHPHVVDVIKRLRRYIGNIKEWKLSDDEREKFEKQASQIRSHADLVYSNFRVLFDIPNDSKFWEVFSESVQEFNDYTKDMNERKVFSLIAEPYTKETFLYQLDDQDEQAEQTTEKENSSQVANIQQEDV